MGKSLLTNSVPKKSTASNSRRIAKSASPDQNPADKSFMLPETLQSRRSLVMRESVYNLDGLLNKKAISLHSGSPKRATTDAEELTQ